ncbi:DUF2637 domain-containing protein [Nocardia concava]|uniref:DUF2637 domain-containing protein n=1 Tax=Nocardia concava TaxID=257281 RepID=UPI00030CCF1D|nr:DUF2637 domain-containing protein [Nocardia concava]
MPIDTDLADDPPQSPTSDPPAADEPGGGAQANRRAHAFFWCELATAATISITGNATHAVLHAQTLTALAAAVAIVPPIALLAAVHGVTILLRAHVHTRLIHTLATLMTALIAVGAFRLSFTALRDLAGVAGIPGMDAWLWPLIIERSMTQATVAILALAHSPRAQKQASPAPRTLSAPSARLIEEFNLGADAEVAHVHGYNEPAHTITSPEGPHEPLGGEPPAGGWSRVATTICDRDPARRRDPTEVAIVLSKHFDQGRTPTQISREIRRSRSTVSRIISDAAQFGAVARSPKVRTDRRQINSPTQL